MQKIFWFGGAEMGVWASEKATMPLILREWMQRYNPARSTIYWFTDGRNREFEQWECTLDVGMGDQGDYFDCLDEARARRKRAVTRYTAQGKDVENDLRGLGYSDSGIGFCTDGCAGRTQARYSPRRIPVNVGDFEVDSRYRWQLIEEEGGQE